MDWDKFLNMTDEEIERTSPPELRNLPDDFWDDAVLVEPVVKTPISIRLDEDVLDWFRRSGPRYQSRINAVLRSYMTRVQKQTNASRSVRRRRRTA